MIGMKAQEITHNLLHADTGKEVWGGGMRASTVTFYLKGDWQANQGDSLAEEDSNHASDKTAQEQTSSPCAMHFSKVFILVGCLAGVVDRVMLLHTRLSMPKMWGGLLCNTDTHTHTHTH